MVIISSCSILSALRRPRVALSRLVARLLRIIGGTPWGPSLIFFMRRHSLTRRALGWSLGVFGTFANLAEAEEYVSRYVPTGHEDPTEHNRQVAKAETTRESDYPMLFFLAPIKAEIRSVFDLGGGIGNLFYLLDSHLDFSEELLWTIYELPLKKESILDFARSKGERRVAFTENFQQASGVDLFVAVGALHYFEPALPDLLRDLSQLPRHVMINRSPFSSGDDIVTVQDYKYWVFPCKLHSATKLASGMRELGYELVASWSVHERRLSVPLHPERKAPYQGFYFRLLMTTRPSSTQLNTEA